MAHSGYPMDGQIHFDASEIWSINGKKGVDLSYVSDRQLDFVNLKPLKRMFSCSGL